jgi:predicted  nucleic acid-binding Zn-ribbon protein
MDIEKTMQFILEVQARLEASAQAHDERLARLEASAQGHEDRVAKLESSVATVTDLVGRLAQAEIRLAERMDAGFQQLREVQTSTEYKLNALIDTVDKLVRRDGHKQ